MPDLDHGPRATGSAGGMSRRLTVLHLVLPHGEGMAGVALGYVRDQVERGWHVSVVCPAEGNLGYQARAAGATVRWWPAPAGASRTLLRAAAELSTVVAELQPDLVHLHGADAGRVGRWALRDRVPTIYQPHGWTFQDRGGGLRAAAWRWERFAARWTSEILCAGEGERRLGRAHGVVAPTTTLPHGVDLAAFTAQGDGERRAARAELGLREVPTAICVGRLTLRKGQQDLLTDWSAVRAAVPGAELILVGDGPDRDFLVRQARKLDGVSLVGGRRDLVSWYAAADVVVAPSRWEGMALVPLEAMACGRSVVACDVSGMRESVPESAGAVVAGDDSEAMVDALAERLLDPGRCEDEGWNARSHVELNHDARTSARDLARIYLRLVGTRRER